MITQKYTQQIQILLAESFSSVVSDLSQPLWFVKKIIFLSARIGRPIQLYLHHTKIADKRCGLCWTADTYQGQLPSPTVPTQYYLRTRDTQRDRLWGHTLVHGPFVMLETANQQWELTPVRQFDLLNWQPPGVTNISFPRLCLVRSEITVSITVLVCSLSCSFQFSQLRNIYV